MKKPLFFLGLIALLALGLAGCDQIKRVAGAEATPAAAPDTSTSAQPVTASGVVIVEGNIVPRDFSRVYSRAGGKVAEVLVKEGGEVEKDAVLVRFGDREPSEAALAAARLDQVNAQQAVDKLNDTAGLAVVEYQTAELSAARELRDAQALLDALDRDVYDKDLDTANAAVAKAKDTLIDAEKDWDLYKDLKQDNADRKNAKTKLDDAQKKYDALQRKRDEKVNELDQLKSNVEAGKQRQANARRELDKRKNGASVDDLAVAQARLDHAKAQVAAAQNALDNLEIRAPFACTVVELDLVAGDLLMANQQVVLLADLSELYVETNDLTEMDVVRVSEGQSASVTPDALNNLDLPATVTEIAASSGKKGGDVTYAVRLKLDKSDPRLRWGMTVEVHFEK